MSENIHVLNATIVNEGEIYKADVFIKDGIIYSIIPHQQKGNTVQNNFFVTFSKVIDATGLYLIPGVIDDHVHFRDPGLVYKGDLNSESKAAVAGGITSFMDMPNVTPNTTTQKLLEEKFEEASKKSLANFSFYIGATNDNFNEIIKVDPRNVCGVKVFMGASTGNMLVDNQDALNKIFSLKNILIAAHCEDESIINTNAKKYKEQFGEDIPIEYHPLIRSRESCYASTKKAVNLAVKYNSRLHVLHLSTEEELQFFSNDKPLKDKQITVEVCVNHLLFNKSDYKKCGRLIKGNPSIKDKSDQKALLKALKNNTIDVIATDHAPHSYEEKQQPYFKAASGLPMVQHALVSMLELYHKKDISLTKIVEKMCHAPAECFVIEKRGYIREGYFADLVLVDLNAPWAVSYDNILYKCKWSPLMGETFSSKVTHTIVNGILVYDNGTFNEEIKGQRLLFLK